MSNCSGNLQADFQCTRRHKALVKLLPSQKKTLFEIIEKYDASLLPRFYWGQRESEYNHINVDTLYVRNSGFFFAFDHTRSGDPVAVFSPGPTSFVHTIGPTSWAHIEALYIPWIDLILREFNAGDPWGDLAKAVSQSDLELDSTTLATKFTYAEYADVAKTLDVIKGLMITFAKSDASALARIEKEIGNIKEAAKEQDRKSIFYQIVGFIASTAVSMSLAPEQTRALYEALKTGFAKFVVLIGN